MKNLVLSTAFILVGIVSQTAHAEIECINGLTAVVCSQHCTDKGMKVIGSITSPSMKNCPAGQTPCQCG